MCVCVCVPVCVCECVCVCVRERERGEREREREREKEREREIKREAGIFNLGLLNCEPLFCPFEMKCMASCILATVITCSALVLTAWSFA